MSANIRSFFDRTTYSFSHVISDPESGECAIVDPVRDYDPACGALSTASADALIDYVNDNRLTVAWILETHIHADHFSAGPYVKARLGGKLGISNQVTCAQKLLGPEFPALPPFACDGSQFDRLLADGESLELGDLTIEIMHTPGHTPACMTLVCGETAFVGDALFMPDFGTGRTDFPGGNAIRLYRSIQRILALPDTTRLYLCHDYGHETRDGYCCETTVAEQRRCNVHLQMHGAEASYVAFREGRDRGLKVPALYHCAVPFNIRGGKAATDRIDTIGRD